MDSLCRSLEDFLHRDNKPETPCLDRFSSVLDAWMHVRDPQELIDCARFDVSHYTRQILFKCNDLYEIVLIGWLPDQETSIHGHPSGGCLFTVLSGVLEETRFDMDRMTTARVLDECHTIQYIDDRMGRHKVRCISRSPAVSLHIYSPPFSSTD